jgi:hypothetical protein
MKIFRDADNNLINIGDWDYMIEDGIERNPLPVGAYEEDVEVVTMPDGARYLATDPRAQ